MLALKRLLALFALLSLPAWAAVPAAVVDAIVAPAWVERNGREQPLVLGDPLRHGDLIRTGEGARVYLQLAEGSTVKLGANAQFSFYSLSLKPRTLFRSAMDVATGAFRFTTAALSRVRERDVTVRVGTATIGIRGTDVWGKAARDLDEVILIEGRIEVRRGAESVEMDQPLQAFVAPKGAAALPLGSISADELKVRARETEIEAGAGGARRNGKWKLLVGRYASESEALQPYDIVRGGGFGARIRPFAVEGGGWSYEVLLPGMASEAEARVVAARIREATGLDSTPERSTDP